MEFPEVITTELGAFATYIPGRNPHFKAHTNIGHAKNALNLRHFKGYKVPGDWRQGCADKATFCRDVALYKLAVLDGGSIWKLHTVLKQGTSKEDYPEIWPNAS